MGGLKHIAERYGVIRADDPRRKVVAEVLFSPSYRISEIEWRCDVEFEPIDDKPFTIAGIDAAQARNLAHEFIDSLMEGQGYRRLTD